MLKMQNFLFSFIIRTLNEQRYLDQLLLSIKNQNFLKGHKFEIILVDSGSSDKTLLIAKTHDCIIANISRENFSFGSSLNLGCSLAKGKFLVFISGHCVPENNEWLENLCTPLMSKKSLYSYGRQIGGMNTKFSESRIFEKYFPAKSKVPQDNFYCNNANAAISKSTWKKYRFNEKLTGLEDIELAKRIWSNHGKISYVANAAVYHYHNESWRQIRWRFEREALALQKIMPQIQVGILDLVRYIIIAIMTDFLAAIKKGKFKKYFFEILFYRIFQYIGVYRGNMEHKKLSIRDKENYFYPQ
jgi:rhamnosyltransferase